MASTVGTVQDLVVENGKVQCQTKTDGMRRRELSDGDIRSSLVGLKRLVSAVLALIAGGELGEITVVVTHPRETTLERQITSLEATHILW
jgi:hypothetical protein